MILQLSERLEDLAPSWNEYHDIAKTDLPGELQLLHN